jgi:hypothetical protein
MCLAEFLNKLLPCCGNADNMMSGICQINISAIFILNSEHDFPLVSEESLIKAAPTERMRIGVEVPRVDQVFENSKVHQS